MSRHSRHGYTLAEVLVSLAILGIGLLAVVQCLTAALLSHLRAERITLATTVAQNAIESMRSSGTLTSSQGSLNDPLLPQGQMTVTVTDYNVPRKLKKVAVDVSWRGQSTQLEHVRLETLVGNHPKHVGG